MNAVIPALPDFLDLQHITSDQFWGLLRLARELKEDRNRLGQNAPIRAKGVANRKTCGIVRRPVDPLPRTQPFEHLPERRRALTKPSLRLERRNIRVDRYL